MNIIREASVDLLLLGSLSRLRTGCVSMEDAATPMIDSKTFDKSLFNFTMYFFN